jgi:hypothetical protein
MNSMSYLSPSHLVLRVDTEPSVFVRPAEESCLNIFPEKVLCENASLTLEF